MSKMFKMLDDALSEALEYVSGNVELPSKVVFFPNAPKSYTAKDIKKIREKLNFTQNEFATWLNVSLNTVQSWEQGTRKPNHSSLRLLEIFDNDFSCVEAICKTKHETGESKRKSKTIHTNYTERSANLPIAAKSKG